MRLVWRFFFIKLGYAQKDGIKREIACDASRLVYCVVRSRDNSVSRLWYLAVQGGADFSQRALRLCS